MVNRTSMPGRSMRGNPERGVVTADSDVAPDGKRFLVSLYIDDAKRAPITVTMNW